MLCAVCKKNETARLMDGGWGEKKPVCGECLVSGRWRELLPEPLPEATEPTPEPSPEQLGVVAKVEPPPVPKKRKKKAKK